MNTRIIHFVWTQVSQTCVNTGFIPFVWTQVSKTCINTSVIHLYEYKQQTSCMSTSHTAWNIQMSKGRIYKGVIKGCHKAGLKTGVIKYSWMQLSNSFSIQFIKTSSYFMLFLCITPSLKFRINVLWGMYLHYSQKHCVSVNLEQPYKKKSKHFRNYQLMLLTFKFSFCINLKSNNQSLHRT